MKPIHVSETVHAPIEAVFAVASDMPNAAERIGGIDSIEMLTEGPVGMGAKWRETRTMFGKQADETMWITEWEPPVPGVASARYVVEARSHGCHYLTPVEFERIGDNETRMSMTMNATAEKLSSKIMMVVFGFMAKSAAKMLQADLRDIKAYCEGSAQPAVV
ncbi:MAG: SRPBCC family protein [Planctomycetota bacterium]